MVPPRVLIPLLGAGAAFGASGAVLALMGLGAPYLLAALGASACAGLVLYGATPPGPVAPDQAAVQARIDALEARASDLRHDLRGALSPALMVSDRLVANSDPVVRKAGETVIRSIEKASALLAASRGAAQPDAPPGDMAPPERMARELPQTGKAAGSGARP